MATTTAVEKAGPLSVPRHGGGTDSSPSTPADSIPAVAPPWQLTGDVYLFSWWSAASTLPAHAYSPLEAGSKFAAAASGQAVGGLGMIQILRYRDSPVGPYDEMLLVPGSFDWSREASAGRPAEVGRNPRISRIYVSQKHSCYNGRRNWNIPKHLARFDWRFGPNGRVTVKVFPHDTHGDASEATPDAVPFFQATYSPLRLAPAFPFATGWLRYLGLDTKVVMPPLPRGPGAHGELPGTNSWCSFLPDQYSRRARLGWFDIAQRPGPGGPGGPLDNFWPGLRRWQLGLKMENAALRFDEPVDVWPAQRANL
ncbi:uncharacterized protein MAM_01378 [Metarhizium album ARSEF 1941]|uniref:Acetoacetate decarboxylase n=1 Tax=Metarhizium album (strain ARSEF 1941) TaxID=1081103 RepID=A0A0B2X568_METAS|nr:uncharacterized protein MAM_01378 [Metarhizium album ARSEF 1941]KHO00600.1 hypothetical protein MAM_01378 [Metarhizium album ARSEF 1941]